MKICICDDDKEICLEIKNFLEEYFSKDENNIYKSKLKINLCKSGIELSNLLLVGETFDLIFLDINLQDMMGFEIANTMRNKLKDRTTQIIYISAEESYAMDLFESRPFDFMIKPITKESLFKVMDYFIDYYLRL